MRRGLALGLALVAASAVAAAEPSPRRIQLYVMPDTQAWAWNQGGTTLAAWQSVAAALCRQRERFAMVLHTGDVVDHGRQRPEEWKNALAVMQQLDACKLPYAIAFGNHDYDDYPHPTGDASWRAFTAKLAHRPREAGPSGRAALFDLAPGWRVLTTDFAPTPEDLGWASGVIAAHPDERFVFLNHHCVSTAGLVPGPSFEWCRKLVVPHPQVRLAVSGHWLGARRDAWQEVPRPGAPPLVALYQNYQHLPALAPWGVVIDLALDSGALCVWTENLLSGETARPEATSPEVGWVGAGPAKQCFAGGDVGLHPGR